MDCPCLIADDQGNCVDCGKPLENPEFNVNNFPQWCPEAANGVMDPDYPLPDFGDIKAIYALAHNTWLEYHRLVEANSDPNTGLPRLRMVGNQIVRVPFKHIFTQVAKQSFTEAQQLGYKGNYQRWAGLVEEASAPVS